MGLFTWLGNLWNKFILAFKEFIATAFSESTKLAIGQFGAFALQIVTKLASTDLSSAEKRAEAFKQIKAEAISQGKALSDSVINLIIELAVEKWKTLTGRNAL
jgi:hypothetical protein